MKKATLLLSTLILMLCLVCFSASAAGENAQNAVNIKLGQNLDIEINDDVYEYYLKFTPTKTGFYEIELQNFIVDETYITTYDSIGEEISFNGWDEFSNRCYDVIELTANKTYFFEISCYEDTILSATITEHTHNFQQDYISKADEYSDGSITYDCSSCYATKETVIPKVSVSLSTNTLVYNGKKQKPVVVVKDRTGKVFKQGTDYTVTYPNSINVDSYDLTVVMKNSKYDVSTEEYYYIDAKPLSKSSIKLSKTTVAYGEKPTVSISGLKKDKDFEYNISYWDVGSQTVTVYGIGNYTGSVNVSFKVVPTKISGLKASKSTTSSIKLSWKSDKNFVTDYYQIYDVSKKKVIDTIKSSKTSYTIKKLKAGKKYSFKVRGYSKVNGKKYYGEWKTIEAATTPKATTLKSVKSSKKKTLAIKINKQSAATGYQVQYSTSKKFTTKTTKSITLKKNSQTSKTVSKLKGGKKYYVRVRTYKTIKINGKSTKVYSSWSKVMSTTVKK